MSERLGRIVFLLGAGASSPAGIPMVQEFTEKFVEERLGTNLNGPLGKCYGNIKTLLNRATGQKEDATPGLERLY